MRNGAHLRLVWRTLHRRVEVTSKVMVMALERFSPELHTTSSLDEVAARCRYRLLLVAPWLVTFSKSLLLLCGSVVLSRLQLSALLDAFHLSHASVVLIEKRFRSSMHVPVTLIVIVLYYRDCPSPNPKLDEPGIPRQVRTVPGRWTANVSSLLWIAAAARG